MDLLTQLMIVAVRMMMKVMSHLISFVLKLNAPICEILRYKFILSINVLQISNYGFSLKPCTLLAQELIYFWKENWDARL